MFREKKDHLLIHETSLRIQLRRLQSQTEKQLDIDPCWINKDDLAKFDIDEDQTDVDIPDSIDNEWVDETDSEQGSQFKDNDTLAAEHKEQQRLLQELKQDIHPILIKLNASIQEYEEKVCSLRTKVMYVC